MGSITLGLIFLAAAYLVYAVYGFVKVGPGTATSTKVQVDHPSTAMMLRRWLLWLAIPFLGPFARPYLRRRRSREADRLTPP